jgi:phosphatidate cytidylyltransferase
VGIILWGGLLRHIFCLLIPLICGYELYRASTDFDSPRCMQLSALSFLMPLGYLFYQFSGFFSGLLLSLILLFCFFVIRIESEVHERDFGRVLPATVLSYVYIGVFGSVPLILSYHLDGLYLLWILLIVVACDTFAYFGGRYFGGAKFAPRISPNKTQSGAVCGLLGGATVAVFAGIYFEFAYSLMHLLAFGVLASVLSIFGDLVESTLKRIFEVKDIGTLLPGHGGLLDRVDGLLFALPVLFLM